MQLPQQRRQANGHAQPLPRQTFFAYRTRSKQWALYAVTASGSSGLPIAIRAFHAASVSPGALATTTEYILAFFQQYQCERTFVQLSELTDFVIFGIVSAIVLGASHTDLPASFSATTKATTWFCAQVLREVQRAKLVEFKDIFVQNCDVASFWTTAFQELKPVHAQTRQAAPRHDLPKPNGGNTNTSANTTTAATQDSNVGHLQNAAPLPSPGSFLTRRRLNSYVAARGGTHGTQNSASVIPAGATARRSCLRIRSQKSDRSSCPANRRARRESHQARHSYLRFSN